MVENETIWWNGKTQKTPSSTVQSLKGITLRLGITQVFIWDANLSDNDTGIQIASFVEYCQHLLNDFRKHIF